MWIKICGITTVEAARACAEAGADAIGFVFADSRRRVSVQSAEKIIAALSPGLEKVGVFVDAPWEEVKEIERRLGLDLLQFHGKESPPYCSRFPEKAIKSFPVASGIDTQAVEAYRGRIKACLFDTFQPGQAGGTGRTWNWEMFTPRLRNRLSGVTFVAAGGLTPVNVTAALQKLKPDGVDTSTGVERGGKKEPALIEEFIETVRRWEDDQLTG